jgi:CheY-like chemotaxis protein
MLSRKIVWIEDDTDVLDPTVKPLRDMGFTIQEYRTYAEADANIEVLRKCDLILLDLILPPGNSTIKGEYLGLKLLRRLRKDLKVKTPIIVYSVVANAHEVVHLEELEELEAVPLTKTVRPSKLKAQVLEALGLSSN